jgi:alkanesulfonate monooxygenase SsuD/methylene tetrahydromethanopterin reductase-like flavin-dependent oxidoreductase (luciferase family)
LKFFLGGLGNWFNDFGLVKEAILEADKLGFDGALIPDHYMWGEIEWMKRPDTNVTLESWIALTYLAAKTEQIHLGTIVTPIPFRPPGILAKMISMIDVLSNGRIVLGVGAGWSQVEFEGYSEWNEPKIRVDKTEEGIELITKLWTQDKVTFEGKYYRAKDAILEPKPVQKPYPLLLFGGQGDRMLKLAGQYADICFIPPFPGGSSFEEGKEKVLRSAEKANRHDKIAFMKGSMVPGFSMGPFDSKELIKSVEAAKEAGASYYQVSFPRNEEYIASLGKFAKEVMPSFK